MMSRISLGGARAVRVAVWVLVLVFATAQELSYFVQFPTVAEDKDHPHVDCIQDSTR